jgi:hypothetical protein
MGRRDFLSLRTKGRQRVLELSCERLYMQWADARSRAGAGGAATDDDVQPWEGEPPTATAVATTEQLLASLDAQLAQVDILRVLDPEWLGDTGFRRDVMARVEGFRRSGGRVE